MFRRLPVLFLLIALLLAPSTAAFGGDEAKEDSAAARLFREAWWSETGTGALDKAHEGYRQAVAAEGSKAVRARALYRLAIVLQRMGRTEEGVRALERLSKEFPGQSALIVKARQRLEEWSAEDLRESFGDWYSRYQYSPAFQAKIVDRILELGSPDPNTHSTAREELLTIGEPALAALRQHSGSANSLLRNAAVDLLIKLGSLPSPEHLMGAVGVWIGSSDFWDLLRSAKQEDRVAYGEMAAVSSDNRGAAWIKAALKGPEAMVEVIAGEGPFSHAATGGYMQSLIRGQPAARVVKRLRGLVLDSEVQLKTRVRLAKELARMQKPDVERPHPAGITDADYVAWIRSGQPALRAVAWPYVADGLVRSPEAWQAAAEVVLSLSPNAKENYHAIHAMLGSLRLAPEGTNIDLAIAAAEHVLQGTRLSSMKWDAAWNKRTPAPPGNAVLPRRVFTEAVGRTRGKHVHGAPRLFWGHNVKAQADLDVLLSLAEGAVEKQVRGEAIEILGAEWRADIGRLTRLLDDPSERLGLATYLIRGLQRNPRLVELGWDQASLTTLVEAAAVTLVKGRNNGMALDGKAYYSAYDQSSMQVLHALLGEPDLFELILQTAQREPNRYSRQLWRLLPNDWSKVEANSDRIVDLLEEAWPRWTSAQRIAGLGVFLVPQLVDVNAEKTQAFLRSCLEDGKATLEAKVLILKLAGRRSAKTQAFWRLLLAREDTPDPLKTQILERLTALTLSDVAGVFDLSKSDQVDAVVAGYLGRLPKTEAVYDALRPAMRPDGPAAGQVFLHFKDAPASRRADLVTRMLEHPDNPKGVQAVFMLRRRNDRADMALWLKALAHPSAGVRQIAATQLGSLYDKSTIKALAKAVDDPSPEVRDAALASLERIEKIEKQKAHWRKYAEEK